MKIHVVVKTNARQEKIVKIDNSHFTVAVLEFPQDGKANEAIIKALAAYFHIAQSRIVLSTGFTNKHKTFIID